MGSSTPAICLAILEADTPITQTKAKYGSYGGVFTSLLHQAADAERIPRSRLELSGWDVVTAPDAEGKGEQEEEDCGGMYRWKRRRGYPDLGQVDAVLITGSRYNAYDDDPWVVRLVEYTKQALEHPNVHVIGVCFGHQIVGRVLGVKVAKNVGGRWEASVCQVRQTVKGKELFGGKEVLNIFQMHRDIVYDYPSGVEQLGSSDVCEVQGMYKPKELITVQGHPEFTEEIVRELLVKRHELGILDDETYAGAESRVGNKHDGVLVAQAFLRMLME